MPTRTSAAPLLDNNPPAPQPGPIPPAVPPQPVVNSAQQASNQIAGGAQNPSQVTGPTTSNPYDTASHANTSTANHLEALLNKGSPLMDYAKTQSLQQSNSRGLLNSSMAVGAANEAMIKSMTPIAAQDAGHAQRLQQNQQQQGFTQQIESQRFAQTLTENQQKHTQTLDALDHETANQIRELGVRHAQELEQLDEQTRNRIEELGVSNQHTMAQQSQKYGLDAGLQLGRQTSQIQSDTTRAITDIMSNADISPQNRNAMIQDVLRFRDADIAYTEALYPVLPSWPGDFSFTPNTTSTGTPDTPTASEGEAERQQQQANTTTPEQRERAEQERLNSNR